MGGGGSAAPAEQAQEPAVSRFSACPSVSKDKLAESSSLMVGVVRVKRPMAFFLRLASNGWGRW